jgi:ABC-type phosphate/phosphonate transport system substrate-binding protein
MDMSSKRLAIVIGCNSYNSERLNDLEYAEKDAEEFYKLLTDPAIGVFSDDESTLLLSSDARVIGEEIHAGLSNAGKQDLVLIYFSGHGLKDDQGRLYLAARDTDPDACLDFLTVPGLVLQRYLNECRSKRICLILDCCYGGSIGDKGDPNMEAEKANIRETLGGQGRAIIASAQGSQPAKETKRYGHGTFTHFMLEGITSGAADENDDGWITPHELYNYVCSRMKDAGIEKQIPTIDLDAAGGDFELALSSRHRDEWYEQIFLEVEKLRLESRYIEALQCLDKGESEAKRESEKENLQTLRSQVAEEQSELKESFEKRILLEQKNKALKARVASEILTMIENPTVLFQEHPNGGHEDLVRALLLERIEPAYLASQWDSEPTEPPSEAALEPALEPAPEPAVEAAPDDIENPAVDDNSTEQKADQTTIEVITSFIPGKSGLSFVLIVVATGLLLWAFRGSIFQPTFDPGNLRLGVYVKEEWNTTSAEKAFDVLKKEINAQFLEEFKDNPYQFGSSKTATYTSIDDLKLALESGKVDIVGELSPRLVFEVRKIATAVINTRYGRSDRYSSVFFARKSARFMDGEKSKREHEFYKLMEGDSTENAEDNNNAKVAVAGMDSTSGHWYPRKRLLDKAGGPEKSFADMSVIYSTAEKIHKAVCSELRSVVAGAVAAFRFKPDFCGPGELEIFDEFGSIPHGAFVARQDLYKDLKATERLVDFQDRWKTAARQSNSELVELGLDEYFPDEWAGKDPDSYYAESFTVFNRPDVKADKKSNRVKYSLLFAALMLVIGSLAYLWSRRSVGPVQPGNSV